ncbi:MAG: DNA-3-methyladenine glycosylase [Solirubrobacterales bacterium]|jgi:DNA-3-methyladenine glycosylase II|nr:DNA-3-methyladenine glycosylase [Solirubrobacterales bacterium]MDX6663586.1 DNA-3-methyladenine glycosylase [Solirubrobacterales bacterium]
MTPGAAGAAKLPAAKQLSAADRALAKADPAIGRLIEAGGPIDSAEDRRASRPDPYEALARAIVGQQLSTKAAASIWEKVLAVFDGRTPTPKQVIEAEPQALRDAGLSWSKVSYFRDLAERIDDGELDLGSVVEMPDEEVIEELTRVKGIGRWTAEMFLIFHLGRPDVFSPGDLGLRRGIERAHGLDDLPEQAEAAVIAERWSPHRTLASLYLWRSLHNEPS